MRDEMDARIWNQHHDRIEAGGESRHTPGSAVGALFDEAVPRLLLMGVAALALSLVSFSATVA